MFGAAALPGATAGASAGKGTAAGAATWAAGRRCNQQPKIRKVPLAMLQKCSHLAVSSTSNTVSTAQPKSQHVSSHLDPIHPVHAHCSAPQYSPYSYKRQAITTLSARQGSAEQGLRSCGDALGRQRAPRRLCRRWPTGAACPGCLTAEAPAREPAQARGHHITPCCCPCAPRLGSKWHPLAEVSNSHRSPHIVWSTISVGQACALSEDVRELWSICIDI